MMISTDQAVFYTSEPCIWDLSLDFFYYNLKVRNKTKTNVFALEPNNDML